MRQLATLNINGWIDEDDEDIRSRAFKKETFLRSANKSYFVEYDEEDGYQIRTGETGNSRSVYAVSRKFAPVFYKEYFDTYGLPVSDYEFYFERPFEGGFYFAQGKVLNEEEIPAENGYVYVIDRVVEPLPTAEEFMEREKDGNSYTDFLELIYEFPKFTTNLDATFQQAGADEGGNIDTLFNLTFPDLAINISSEITDPTGTSSKGNIQYHHAMFAPTNDAFTEFLENYAEGPNQWGSLDNMPRSLKKIIVNSYMSSNIVYGSDINGGFVNAERDELLINEENIVQRGFGSNSTFVGLNKAIVPRAFSSVSAPVYLRRGFYTFLSAIEETNILDALKLKDQYYTFFVIRDQFTGVLADSSLMITERNNRLAFEGFNRSSLSKEAISISDLRKKILNHVGVAAPPGIANKEFIKNLAGNYLVFDNLNTIVSGTAPTTYGLNGDSLIDAQPVLLLEATDNGESYEIPTWLSFSSSPMSLNVYNLNPNFMGLLEDAGLATNIIGDEYDLIFLSQGTSYTVFIPSIEALNKYNTDTLTTEELSNFLKNHFVPNHLIFTDGSVPSGDYPTMNVSEGVHLKLTCNPDLITIRDKNGFEIEMVEAEDENANVISTTRIGSSSDNSEWNFISTGLVHSIDTVFISGMFQ